MKIQTALKDLSYQIIWGEADQEVKEVIYDSRKAAEGVLFVCVKGTAVDGHDFAGEVAGKGAAALVVQEDVKVPEDVTVIKVKDTRELRLSVLTVQEKLLPIFPQPDLVSRRRR